MVVKLCLAVVIVLLAALLVAHCDVQHAARPQTYNSSRS